MDRSQVVQYRAKKSRRPSQLLPPSQSKLLFFHLRMNSLVDRQIDPNIRLLLALPKAAMSAIFVRRRHRKVRDVCATH
jgi:hypothetical protein